MYPSSRAGVGNILAINFISRMMEKCAKCGAETQVLHAGVPICISCSAASEAKRKPASSTPQHPASELSLREVNSKLAAARAEYRKALARLRGDFASNNTDGGQALQNATIELSLAARKYEDALRDFMDYANPHHRSG